VLQVFAEESINLTRIESIPKGAGDYVFLLDFVGSNKDDKVVGAISQVKEITTSFRLMGCYKERKVA
jgi:prephenate dehydratase